MWYVAKRAHTQELLNDLKIIDGYNHSAIARHICSQGAANTTDVATDAYVRN